MKLVYFTKNDDEIEWTMKESKEKAIKSRQSLTDGLLDFENDKKGLLKQPTIALPELGSLNDDEEAKKFPIITKVEKNVTLNSVMSISFGFGGTNATLVFEKI